MKSLLSAEHVQALAEMRQPICLSGLNHQRRRAVAESILRVSLGNKFDLDSPHPDVTVVSCPIREDSTTGRSIGIDAVKAMVDRLCLTPCQGPIRVGFIEPASALTAESQNALLRFVEEPTKTSRVMLSSRRAEELLPTLLSRCLVVRLPGRAGGDGESDGLAERYDEDPKLVEQVYDFLDDPDAVEKLLEFRLTKAGIRLYEMVSQGNLPDSKITGSFLEKRVPAAEGCPLFVEIVFAAVCSRIPRTSGQARQDLIRLARKLLVLQSELRYNPARPVVLDSVLEWLDDVRDGIPAAAR